MPYHVTVSYPEPMSHSNRLRPEWRFDVDEATAINEYLVPLKTMAVVFINGKARQFDENIEGKRKITIFFTEDDSKSYFERVKNDSSSVEIVSEQGFHLIKDGRISGKEVAILYLADDVTNDLVTKSSTSSVPDTSYVSDKVFLVHGRNTASLNRVTIFLQKLKLQPVILFEQPNAGQTVIEKLEEHTNVGFAVVLLTGDDEGRLKTSGDSLPLVVRARQNVVFEAGYLMARLTRKNVCALVDHGVEIPSDLSGLVYTAFDESDNWQMSVARDMRKAGLRVDLNDLVS